MKRQLTTEERELNEACKDGQDAGIGWVEHKHQYNLTLADLEALRASYGKEQLHEVAVNLCSLAVDDPKREQWLFGFVIGVQNELIDQINEADGHPNAAWSGDPSGVIDF